MTRHAYQPVTPQGACCHPGCDDIWDLDGTHDLHLAPPVVTDKPPAVHARVSLHTAPDMTPEPTSGVITEWLAMRGYRLTVQAVLKAREALLVARRGPRVTCPAVFLPDNGLWHTGDPVEIRVLDNDGPCPECGGSGQSVSTDPGRAIGNVPGVGPYTRGCTQPVVCLACQGGRHALCYGGTCGCGCDDQEPGT